MGRRKKRLRAISNESSSSENNGGVKNNGRFSLLSSTEDEVSVSQILSEANSILYETDNDNTVNEGEVFSENKNIDLMQGAECGCMVQKIMAESEQMEFLVNSDPSYSDIMKCLSNVLKKLDGIDSCLKKLETLENKVDKVEKDITKLWKFVEDKVGRIRDRVVFIEQKTESNEFSVNQMQDRVIELEKERSALKDDLVYIQSQSMRNNLVFVNIPEAPTETPEDSEKKLRDFIVGQLHLAQGLVDKIQFKRVHRMGHKPSGSTS